MPEAKLAVAPAPSLERLPFTLPDFTRVAWVSEQARQVWEPRLSRITAAWLEVEWRAVVAGARRCAVTIAGPEEFLSQAPRWAEAGLGAVPVEVLALSRQPYAATSPPAQPGQPFAFRFVVGRPTDVASFTCAWKAADQEAIGDLLGYPPCCRDFFRRTWVDDAMVDTTWPMAFATASPGEGATTIDVHGAPQANILWRWMGARAVPHLPCRFDCEFTVELADRLAVVGRTVGFEEEMRWLGEILSWPVEWSALHGIAEIRTPVLKVSTRTDATARRYVVRRHGDAYPREGARGLAFPYQAPSRLRFTASPRFRRGLHHVLAAPGSPPEWMAADNGFASIADMDSAHRSIVELATSVLPDGGGRVVDLGCGNGALLRKLMDAVPGVVPFGIDIDQTRIDHARIVHPDFADHFLVGHMLDDDRLWRGADRYALAVLMPGRLLDGGPAAAAAALRSRLFERCDRLLVYAYGDWLTRAGALAGLSTDAGLVLIDGDVGARAAMAKVGSTNGAEAGR